MYAKSASDSTPDADWPLLLLLLDDEEPVMISAPRGSAPAIMTPAWSAVARSSLV